MEYQFTHTMHGIVAKCSMDHEAFAHWLNAEVIDNRELINLVLGQIERCRNAFPNDYEWFLEGKEYSLYLNESEVMVKANNLDDAFLGEMEEGFEIYDQESIAFCGLDDFEKFLTAYQRFSHSYH